jgi:hypothetical protein
MAVQPSSMYVLTHLRDLHAAAHVAQRGRDRCQWGAVPPHNHAVPPAKAAVVLVLVPAGGRDLRNVVVSVRASQTLTLPLTLPCPPRCKSSTWFHLEAEI